MFFTSKNPLVAPFSETCAFTSRKYVAEQGLIVLKPFEKQKLIKLLRFCLE